MEDPLPHPTTHTAKQTEDLSKYATTHAVEQTNELDDVGVGPVSMPDLPPRLRITTPQQFKAIGDPLRERILGIIQMRPATAKQIADSLGIPPGTIGYHLQVLEAAGLAQVVARRLVRGIVAKYYTRTARIFDFAFPPALESRMASSLQIMTKAREELAESLAAQGAKTLKTEGDLVACNVAFPHARLSPERLKVYEERLARLLEDFLGEPNDPKGQVYGLSFALFLAPPYLQGSPHASEADETQAEA
jgi:DNA-binding transcriptional ArsR family regulator